jgi:hypothetical protein
VKTIEELKRKIVTQKVIILQLQGAGVENQATISRREATTGELQAGMAPDPP